MIELRHTVAGYEFTFRPPRTTRDVLDWLLWISCIECETPQESIGAQVEAGAQWACKWLTPRHTVEELSEIILNISDTEAHRLPNLVGLCNAMCDAAGLPDSVLEGMREMMDKQNEVPTDFVPDGMCTCPRCRKGIENPRNVLCAYDSLDPRSIRVGALVAGLGDTSEPWYLTQARSTMERAEGRRIAYERKKQEEEEEYKRIMRDKGLMRG